MNTTTRKDKYCNNYEEALLSKTFRFVFLKTLKKCGWKNQKNLQNIFDRFISQEPISDEEKEIFNAFLNDRDVKIHAEEIRQQINFSRMSEKEKKEIMDDFTAEHLINTLQNKISGEVFLTLDNKAVEVLQTYWDLQVLRIYKNKVPYYAIKKLWEDINSVDFIFTWEETPYILKDTYYNNLPVFFAQKWENQIFGTTNWVNHYYKIVFSYVWLAYEFKWKLYYDWELQNKWGEKLSSWVVVFWDEFNEDGTIKYITLDNIPKAIAEKFKEE